MLRRKILTARSVHISKQFVKIPPCIDYAVNFHELFLFIDGIKNCVVFDYKDAILIFQRFHRLINPAGIRKLLQAGYGFVQCVKQVKGCLWREKRLSDIVYGVCDVAIGDCKVRKLIHPPLLSAETCVSKRKTLRHA